MRSCDISMTRAWVYREVDLVRTKAKKRDKRSGKENMLIKQKIFSRLEREELEYIASDLVVLLQHNLY